MFFLRQLIKYNNNPESLSNMICADIYKPLNNDAGAAVARWTIPWATRTFENAMPDAELHPNVKCAFDFIIYSQTGEHCVTAGGVKIGRDMVRFFRDQKAARQSQDANIRLAA